MNIRLHREQAKQLGRTRHPWIFRSALCEQSIPLENGELVAVEDESGAALGHGFYSSGSKIACRLLNWGASPLPSDWLEQRLHAALDVRRLLHLKSDAYRLVNAEGDFFPGLIIDVYADTIVIRPSIRGTERLAPRMTDALLTLFPGASVYLKRDEKAARAERLELASGFLARGAAGRTAGGAAGVIDGAARTEVMIRENGLSYAVDIREGQKTGFYLDQRDNRELVGMAAAGKKVLNLFSYTGGFALAALHYGAVWADSVDSSQAAVALAERNYGLNSFSQKHRVRWIRDDGFEFLCRAENYDIIVLDPPPFARSKGEVPGALRGYRRLQLEALKRLPPGGLLATFSCSGAVSEEAFRRVLFEAAQAAGRRLRILRELHAAPDHPYSLPHPEGEYLKGFMAYAD